MNYKVPFHSGSESPSGTEQSRGPETSITQHMDGVSTRGKLNINYSFGNI